MPGWHELTKSLQGSGKIKMAGIVVEQHGERARLFMQWKKMDWPVMVDTLNLLNLPFVPITLFIDETGKIHSLAPPYNRAKAALEAFLKEDGTEDGAVERTAGAASLERPNPEGLKPGEDGVRVSDAAGNEPSEESGDGTAEVEAAAWLDYGDALVLWGGQEGLDKAVEAFGKARTLEPENDRIPFRQGVAFRMRFDAPSRQAGDFRKAVASWEAALKLAPNNYIYRRRIQQYGPRLDKPYPFYDWVPTARKEIAGRGEAPHPLITEPGGAEFALPAWNQAPAAEEPISPDPEGSIERDPGFVLAEYVVVPSTDANRAGFRVHVFLQPGKKGSWNNEADPLELWVDSPVGWSVIGRHQTAPNPAGPAESRETRHLEFEVTPPKSDAGSVTLPAFVLYYVCDSATKACRYLRQDLSISIPMKD